MTTEKARVYITIDTETSLGGGWTNPGSPPVPLDRTVYGRYGSKFYGIPLIMDILEKYGFRATFFTEVFCSYCLGDEGVGKLLHYIRDRGHDPQLHLHPTYRFYRDFLKGGPRRETDLMAQLSPAEQCELIAEGVRLFRDLSGSSPRAYRAGCYGASEVTLAALRESGVAIDASYNLAYQGVTCQFQKGLLNAPVLLEGVYEFPVTVFRLAGVSGYKALEISAVSVNEILDTIRARRKAGTLHTVLVLHSFSLLKSRSNEFDAYRPDRIVIQRLRRLCARLSELRDEIEVGVLGEEDLDSVRLDQSHLVPSLGLLQASMRKALQGVNRFPWL